MERMQIRESEVLIKRNAVKERGVKKQKSKRKEVGDKIENDREMAGRKKEQGGETERKHRCV